MELKLWEHQELGRKRCENLNSHMLSMEVGCIAEGVMIKVNRGGCSREYPIEEVYKRFNSSWYKEVDSNIRAFKDTHIGLHKMENIIFSGEKEVYKVLLEDKKEIELTIDHEILTISGFKEVKDIEVGTPVMVDNLTKHKAKKNKKKKIKKNYLKRRVPLSYPQGRIQNYFRKDRNYFEYYKERDNHILIMEAKINGYNDLEDYLHHLNSTDDYSSLTIIDSSQFSVHHKDHNTRNNNIDNLELMSKEEHARHHGKYTHFSHGIPEYSRVKEIKKVGVKKTYDIVCADPHRNFVANGIVVHNCGKTATLISIYKDKCNNHQKMLPMLIFSPPITLRNWKREILLWAKIPEHKIIILDGPLKKRVERLQQARELWGDELILITNYEALVQRNKDLFLELKKFCATSKNTFLTCDESHKLKDSSSKTSKQVYQLSQFCQFRFLLTGTPVLNSEMDIFQQFKVMDPGIFGKSITAFRNLYFTNIFANVPHMSFPKYEIKTEMIDHLNKIINKHSYYVKKSECLDLPPLVKKTYEVELASDQKRAYKQMEKEFVAFLTGIAKEPVQSVANLVITRTLRLQQIVSGFIKDEDGEEHLFKKNPRAEALREVLQNIIDMDQKVIVWAVFKKNYETITKVCKDLGVKYVEAHGGISNQKKFDAVEEFNTGTARVFIAHPGALGIGINLVAASYSVYYSRNFSLEYDLQSEARNYRGGSEIHESITRIDLVCPGTIDEDILGALEGKFSMAQRITKLKEKYVHNK